MNYLVLLNVDSEFSYVPIVRLTISLQLWSILLIAYLSAYVDGCYYAEASLSGVEPLMQKVQSEIRRVDAEILAAVRQQVSLFLPSPSIWFRILVHVLCGFYDS